MSQPPPPAGAPQHPWTSPAAPSRPPADQVPGPYPPADPYQPGGRYHHASQPTSPYLPTNPHVLPYQPAVQPAVPTGSPLDAYAYRLPAPRRRTGLVVAVVVGAVAALAVLAVVVLALVGLVEGGRSYGEDAELDRLWDACAEGSAVACDDLYSESPLGSEYEEFGDTCGGRFPAGERLWCRGRM